MIKTTAIESLADEATAHILANPNMGKEELLANMLNWFLQVQGIHRSELQKKLEFFRGTVDFLDLYGDDPDSKLVKDLNSVMEKLRKQWGM